MNIALFFRRLRIAPALLLTVSGPAAASKEGAGIAEGLLVMAFGAVALVLLVGLVTGGVVAVRRGRSAWRGMLVGFSVGLGGLLGLVFLLYLVFSLPGQLRQRRDAREEAEVAQWLLPLGRLQAGHLGVTLAQLQASKPPYFIASSRLAEALLSALPRGRIPAAPEDVSALRAFIASKPQFEVPHTMPRLQGLVSWMQWPYAVDEAVETCHAESDCMAAYADFLFEDCGKHFDVCARDVHIEAVSRLMERLRARPSNMPGAYSVVSTLHALRSRLALANLQSGTVRARMAALLEPSPAGYERGFDDRLAAALVSPLRRMPEPLTQDDRAALEEFIAEAHAGKRMAPPYPCPRLPGGCDTSIPALRGAIAWAYAGPVVAVAVTECGGDDRGGCAMGYAEALLAYCATHASECRAAAGAADLQRLIDAIGPQNTPNKQHVAAHLRKLGEA